MARAFFAALDAEEWSAAAALVGPQTAERFQREQMIFARVEERTPRTTPQALQRQDPGMSREAAEYMADTFDTQRELNGIESRFAGTRTAAELGALAPQEALARFAKAQSVHNRHLRAEEHAMRSAPPGTQVPEPPRIVRRILGSVAEGADLVHVTYRTEWYDGETKSPRSPVDVLTLRYTEAGWRVFDTDVTGFGGGRLLFPDGPMALEGMQEAFEATLRAVQP